MINKYTNKQGGLLAVIMAMVMVFAGAAFVAAEVDAATPVYVDSTFTGTPDGTEDNPYSTLQDAISNVDSSGIVILKSNVILSDVVYINKNITIDGKEYDITIGKRIVIGSSSNPGTPNVVLKDIDFIMVDNGYTTTEDSQILNYGILTLNGCSFSGNNAEYAINTYDGSTVTAINGTDFATKKLTIHDATVDLTGAVNVYLNINGTTELEIIAGTTNPASKQIRISENTTIDSISVRSGSKVTLSTDVPVSKIMGKGNGIIESANGSSIVGATIMQYETDASSITFNGVGFEGANTIQDEIGVTLTNITVNEDAKLTVVKDATVNGRMTNKGTLNLYTNVGSVTNEGTVNILSNVIDSNTTISGGTIDTSAVNSNVNIDGDVSGDVTYNQYQTVTIVGDTNIIDKGKLIVGGTLIIDEGVTLVVEEGGQLIVDSVYGKVQNYGTVIVEGTLSITSATVENKGTIVADADGATGTEFSIAGTLINEGVFEITDEDTVTVTQKIINKKDATLSIMGVLINSAAIIDNEGTISVDGTVSGDINQMADGAEVQIISVSGNIRVIDGTFEKSGNKDLTNADSSNAIRITADGNNVAGGLSIVTIVSAVKDAGVTDYYKQMSVEGMINAMNEVDDSALVTVNLNAPDAIVVGDLSIGEDVKFTNWNVMTITGNVSVVDKATFINTNGEVHVDGLMTIVGNELDGDVYAVEYVTGTTDKTYYYTTLANAIEGASAAGVKKVDILGDIVIKTDVTIPTGMTVKQTAAEVTIGDKEDVTVTVSEGAKYDVAALAINVEKGTLYIADKKTGITKNADVESEVKSEGEKDLRYTTLANAIAAAGSDVVTIELNGPVTVKSDLTIPANVTVDTNTQDFDVQGATLTIDGTLFLNGGTYTVTDVDNSNGTTSEGKVILNGYMKSENMMTYDGKAYPAGAYYAADLIYYITSVANSVNIINDADEDTIAIFGSNKVGDIAYAGTSDDSITINVKGDLEAKSMTVDEGTIEFFGNKFIGSITNGVGTVALNGTALNGFKVVSATDSEGTEKFTLAGGFTVDSSVKDNAVTISGKTILNGFVATPIIIDGEVDVIKTVTLTDVTVNGTITIDNTQTLTVANAYVFGSIITDAPTTSKVAGAFIATNLYLGLEADDVAKNLGAVATVDGNIKVNGVMYVLAGSAFPADLVKEDTPAVELYVEGKLWMTIYNFDNSSVTVNQIPVENVEFMGWAKEEGKPGYAVDGTTVNKNFTIDFDNEKYYADIKYDIYTVNFVKAEGIDDIYIDGVLVKTGTTVAAGQHTVSYTLANGYTGEAKMLVDGKEVSGLTFTVGGDDLDYTITLQGIEKAPAEVGGGDAPVADKDEGMDLTDILLIVLVVLIVIMAIIVALRMMRS